ncbi:OmpA family protein [Pseudoxanthomonas wuyuanensis]|uniref:Beta-barrel assembly machine subunit BamE n=1 Tax=Pseudoxanthomonas wuyuanensis TaxID=1073196 RepID=A0A286D5W0_9GAMM|nr:OmpA family protein [Pseudoxanthomonas wuyuanensis]KAF1716095.1 flagellar motor protein MotB [Pseudoxanthomonas wuyuanensis]SOD54040.1 Beta-barrel assembly machine subunit BamE [Pseudoxanthomonas wuyuanensis]
MDIRNNSARITRFALCALIAAAVLPACTRHVSRGIAPDAQADEVIFPSADNVVLKEGTFPNLDNLRQIGPGLSKDQLYDLIGRPHFREGYAAREWDYLFHFRQGGKIVTCQYKVIFDKDYLGQAFHWSPAGCADLLKTDAPGADAPVARAPQRFELSADALFAFGRSDLKDIQPREREELAAIASQLKDSKAAIIQVIGHTDRIGSEAANQALSQRRAQTVREFLIQNGVAADGLSAHGVGESQPVKQCADSLPHDELVACLQPNRRVEVAVMGFQ